MKVLLPRPDGNVRTAVEDYISAEQTLDLVCLCPEVDGIDRDILHLRRKGHSGQGLADLLGVSKATICVRLEKMLRLYYELRDGEGVLLDSEPVDETELEEA